MGRKPKPPKPPRASIYQFKVTETTDVSNPALSKTSGIMFEVAPPGPPPPPPPPTDNFIDNNGIQDFVDQNGVTLFVDQNNIALGTH